MNQIQTSIMNKTVVAAVLSATGKMFVTSGSYEDSKVWGDNKSTVLNLTLSMEPFGFVLSEDLCKALSHQSVEHIYVLGDVLLTYLKKSVGANYLYKPLYPNFPAQVLNADEEELIQNAIGHYLGDWFGVRVLPKYESQFRELVKNFPNPKVIQLCTEEYLQEYVGNMVFSKVSYSEAQRVDLALISQYLKENKKIDAIIEKTAIVNKENLAFWGNLYLANNWDFKTVFDNRFETVIDVLRLIAAYSNADMSLAKTLKVAKLPRAMRKLFLSILEDVIKKSKDKEQVLENFLTYRSEWVRIAHALHIGEYANKFPQAYDCLHRIRNNEKIETFNSRVELAFENGDIQSIIQSLQKRPGVFARTLSRVLVTQKANYVEKKKSLSKKKKAELEAPTLNYVKSEPLLSAMAQKLKSLDLKFDKVETVVPLNTVESVTVLEQVEEVENIPFNGLFSEKDRNDVLNAFEKVVDSVATPVLLQVHAHFKNMSKKMVLGGRSFMPKGGLSKIFYQEGTVAKYNLDDCQRVESIVERALIQRFSALPKLGKVFVSPTLETQNVPFAMRSASKALKTVARGSSFKLENEDSNLRLFLWWKEPKNNRVDVDLSVSMYGEEFNNLGHCSYWNLKDSGLTHSGDITSAPNGACEFIDIDRKELSKDVAYIVCTLTSYSGQKYCDLPECFAGWMERDVLENGQVFDSRTVQNKIDLSSDTTDIMPIVYDVRNNRMIWIDTSYGNGAICSNAQKNVDTISMILKSWVEGSKPTLYDLFIMHAKARGEIVEKREDAQQVFDLHEGVTPYDFDVITSEYMQG